MALVNDFNARVQALKTGGVTSVPQPTVSQPQGGSMVNDFNDRISRISQPTPIIAQAQPSILSQAGNIFSLLGSKSSDLLKKAGNFLDAVLPKPMISPIPTEKQPVSKLPLGYMNPSGKTISDLDKTLGPLLFKIYTPLEYQVPGQFTGEMLPGVKPTAGKAVGGLIDDALMAFLPVARVKPTKVRNILKEGINITEGIRTGATFAAVTALIQGMKQEKIELPDLLLNGGIGFLLGSFEPEVMKGIKRDIVLSSKKILEDFGFENKDFKNPEILKSKWRDTVKTLHPDVGGNPTQFMKFTDAFNKVTSAGMDSKWSLKDSTTWMDFLWNKAGKTKEELFQKANETFRSFLEGILGKKGKTMELTPKSAGDIVIGSNLEKSAVGKLILKTSIEAQQQGKNVAVTQLDKTIKGDQIAQTPQGVNVGVRMVEPTDNADKLPSTIEAMKQPPPSVSGVNVGALKDEGNFRILRINTKTMKPLGNELVSTDNIAEISYTNKELTATKGNQNAFVELTRKKLQEMRLLSPPVSGVPIEKGGGISKLPELETQLKTRLSQKQEEVQNAISEIMAELDVAEPGQRIRIENPESTTPTILGVKSTFPSWIPADLRDKKLFNKVISQLVSIADNPKYPTEGKKTRELYNEIISEIGSRAGIDLTDIQNSIMGLYEKPIPPAKEISRGAQGAEAVTAKAIPKKPAEKVVGVPREGKVYASMDRFKDIENVTKNINNYKIIEFPEMLRLAKDLMGGVPSIKLPRYRQMFGGRPYGLFVGGGKGKIILNPNIFKEPEQAAKTFAHEIGHLADYLPEKTLMRGNILGRIASLHKYVSGIFGDLENKTIRKELMDLSAKWKGEFERVKGTSYDEYRRSSKELYADAVSVLFNDPVLLKKDAPLFFKGFFDNLDWKPEFKKNFFELQDLLNKDEEALFAERDRTMEESYRKGEDIFYAKELEKTKRKYNLFFRMRILFDNKNQAIINKVKEAERKGAKIEDYENPMYGIQGLNYLDGKLKNYINDTFQPVYEQAQMIPEGWNLLGKIVQLERSVNERGELANPQGFDPKTAQEQLNWLEKQSTPEEWAKIQKAKEQFRIAVQKTVDLAEKEGFYTPELIKQMRANPTYATFQVIDYLDTYVSSKVYKSVGTLKDIANPATSTVMKSVSILKAMERNKVKRDMVDFLSENYGKEIEKADSRFVNEKRPREFLEPRDRDKGLVIAIREGKPEGYYIDKEISNSLNYLSNETISMASRVIKIISGSPFYRPLFTTVNLGFQTFNFVRDFSRYWKNIPDRTLGEAITSMPRAVLRYLQAAPHAAKRVLNKPDEIIKAMENSKILGLTYNDIFSEPADVEDRQIERVLQRTGILEKEKKRGIMTPIYKVLEGVELLGNFIETLPKVAGYLDLKNKLPENEMAYFVRTKLGSPDFRVTGTFTPISNNIFLFSNAIKEGIKSDFDISTHAKTRGGYWWKTVLVNLLPKIIMAGIGAGLLGKWYKDRMDDASEYDKTNYTILPLGVDEKGKTVYLRIPQDETGRLFGGILWKLLKTYTKGKAEIADLFQVISFGAGQFPNLSPNFSGIGAMVEYMSGLNPYDSYRGRSIIPDREFKAGPKYSLPIFMKWLLQNQGLGIVFPNYTVENPGQLQKVLGFPVISNIAGRWIKSSDYGRTEQLKEEGQKVEAVKAAENIEEDEIIKKAVEEYRKGEQTTARRIQIINDTVKQIYSNLPKEQRNTQKLSALRKEMKIAIVKGEADPNLNALIRAVSNEEKAVLLNGMEKRMDAEEFNQLKKTAMENKIISGDVIIKFNKLK